ncbi:DUF2255 family protein [Pseudomonas syringae pv. syringae]|uniref:DUF2255 family protein n=1 Tax=Pseudomonas syringae TaxID=317 RepID=UPI0023F7DB76|nr:DUF2255 family protein [Pseudomonas syringae]MDF5890338.1 DUF2255 family protein [Pseudomonas syringae pv. syringae]
MTSHFLKSASLACVLSTAGPLAQVALAADQASVAPQSNAEQRTPINWASADLQKIVQADDLHIAPFRDDGVTYGTPTFIWCVEVDGSLYVRAYNGTKSSWYQAAIKQKAGEIIAAGMTRPVSFQPVSGAINDRIDAAYRQKYSASSYLAPMISERSRAATVRVLPKDAGS